MMAVVIGGIGGGPSGVTGIVRSGQQLQIMANFGDSPYIGRSSYGRALIKRARVLPTRKARQPCYDVLQQGEVVVI
jgi:hypothetical protein